MIECICVNACAGSFELHDVSFVVPEGAYAVLSGPSASGKTTLLEAISGAAEPRSGTIRLNGRDVRGVPPEQRRLGVVHQHGYLFPHLTVRENVEYGAHDAASARELMQRFAVYHLADRGVVALSGGERQVVALCRALATRPHILLLDEPFSALDSSRREQVRTEAAALHHDWQLTTMHVTHDENEALAVATMRLHMNDGTLSR